MSRPKLFAEGISAKAKKSHGPVPAHIVPILNEVFEPYNSLLLKLLLSNPFVFNPHALMSEFKPYVSPPPKKDSAAAPEPELPRLPEPAIKRARGEVKQ